MIKAALAFLVFSLTLVIQGYSAPILAADAREIRDALQRELTELDVQAEANSAAGSSLTPPLADGRESLDNPLVSINTTLGEIILELFPQEAPLAVTNFIDLAEGNKSFTDAETGEQIQRPYYDGLIFHRVIDSFMIQGGSPTGLGDGGPGYTFDDEINALSLGLDKMPILMEGGYPHPLLGISSQADFQEKILVPLYALMGIDNPLALDTNIENINQRLENMTVKESLENLGYQYTQALLSRNPVRGIIAMANSGPDTNGSQFFITLADAEWLTGKHTVFGEIRTGFDVIDAIGRVRVDAESKPFRRIEIISIRQITE